MLCSHPEEMTERDESDPCQTISTLYPQSTTGVVTLQFSVLVSLLVCKIHPGVLRCDRTLHIDYKTNATGCIQLVLFVHRQNHCWSLFSFLFLHACLSFYSSQWKWRLAASLTTCEKWTPTRWGRTTTAAAASLRYDVSDIFEFQVGLKIF